MAKAKHECYSTTPIAMGKHCAHCDECGAQTVNIVPPKPKAKAKAKAKAG